MFDFQLISQYHGVEVLCGDLPVQQLHRLTRGRDVKRRVRRGAGVQSL